MRQAIKGEIYMEDYGVPVKETALSNP